MASLRLLSTSELLTSELLRGLGVTEKSWPALDDRVLSLFCHVVDVMFFLTDLLRVVFLLLDCERCHGCSCDPSSPHPPSVVESSFCDNRRDPQFA